MLKRFLVAFQFGMFFHARREWSYKAFGPPSWRSWEGPFDHLKKEMLEVEKAKTPAERNEELVDTLFLTLDALDRTGMTPAEIVAAVTAKLKKNQVRDWGDWRTKDPTKAVEHTRTPEEEKRKRDEVA